MSVARVWGTSGAAVLAALLSLLPGACRAATITFHFSGTVHTVFDFSGELGPLGVVNGAPISVTYAFESTTPDADPATDRGVYDAVTSLDLEVASFVATNSSTGTITVENNFLIYGRRQDGYYLQIPLVSAQASGAMLIGFALIDQQRGAFSSDALPLLPPDLVSFESREFTLIQGPSLVLGTLDTLVLIVPEPSPTLLVLVALALLGGYRSAAARSRKMLAG